MDSRIAARFFRVSPKPENAPDFADLLLAEAQKSRADRERDIGGNILLRVEQCEADGDFVSGDLCRKQVLNLPPEAGPDGLTATILPEGKGHGHLAAFHYHKPTRILLLQNNIQCATPSRLGVYVMMLNADSVFSFLPVLREDAMDRFKARKPRAFTVRFASPQNLESLDDRNLTSVKGARLLAEAFHGLYLTVTVDVGKSTKKHLDNVQAEVEGLLASGADIKTLRVKTNEMDDDPGIDFLKEHLKCAQTFDLPDDIESHYAVRKAYLSAEFNKRLALLNKQFGPKKKD